MMNASTIHPVAEALIITSANMGVAWLMNYLIHSTLLQAAVHIWTRRVATAASVRAVLWRSAILLPVATATSGLWLAPRRVGPAAEASEAVTTWLGTQAGVAVAALIVGLGTILTVSVIAARCAVTARQLLWPRVQGSWRDTLALWEIVVEGGFAMPRLTQSEVLSVPAAVGRNEICLPRDWPGELTVEEQAAIVTHELAHLTRHDPIWMMAAYVCARACWFQPLNPVALRRLHQATEEAADAVAVERTRRPRALASALVKLAPRVVHHPLLATANGGAIIRRVALLQSYAGRADLVGSGVQSRRFASMLMLAAAVVVATISGVHMTVGRASHAIPWLVPGKDAPNERMLAVRNFDRSLRAFFRGH